MKFCRLRLNIVVSWAERSAGKARSSSSKLLRHLPVRLQRVTWYHDEVTWYVAEHVLALVLCVLLAATPRRAHWTTNSLLSLPGIRLGNALKYYNLTLWRSGLLPCGYSCNASCARPGQAVICNFDIQALWRSGLNARVPGGQKLQITA